MADDIANLVIKVDSDGVEKASDNLDKMSGESAQAEKSTKNLGDRVQNAKAKLLAFAAAIGGIALAFKKAIAVQRQFQKAISDLSAITGATGADLKFYKEQARLIGSTTTLSATQAADAFKLMASAKPDLLESKEALAAVTKEAVTLAEAAGVDLPAAANIVGAAMNQFSAGAENASRFVNILAAGSKFGASEVEAIGEALRTSGVVAANTGLTFEETNAALQILASGAIKGSEAGTAFKGVLLQLTTQTNDQFNPAIVGMQKAFENLSDANLSATKQKKLFGAEGITAAKILMQEAGSLDVLTQKLSGTNTALEQAAIRTDNLDGDMLSLNSKWEDAGIELGTIFNPAMRTMVQWMARAGDFVKIMIAEFGDWGDSIGAVAAIINRAINFDIEGVKQIWAEREERAKAHVERMNAIWDGEETPDGGQNRNAGTDNSEQLEKARADARRKRQEELARIKKEQAEATAQAERELAEKQIETEQEIFLRRIESLKEFMMTRREREIEDYEMRLADLELAEQKKLDIGMTYAEARETLQEKHNARLAELDKKHSKAELTWDQKTAKEKTQTVVGGLQEITNGIALESRTAFEIQKASSTAQAIINAHTGASESLAKYPWPLAGVMAGLHYAAGIARVKAIQNTSFRSTSTSGGSAGGGTAAPVEPSDFVTQPVEETQASSQITINIEGNIIGTEDGLRDIIVESIQRADANDEIRILQNG